MAKREQVAKKTLPFIMREFFELEKLLILIETVEKNETSESINQLVKEIKRILRKLRGGVFASEERIVYRLSSQYEHLKEAFRFSAGELEPKERITVDKLLEEGDVLNKQLVKLGARGGDLERALYKARDNPNAQNIGFVKSLLQEGITTDKAFEAIVQKIISLFKETTILKSQLLPSITFPELAIIIMEARDFPNAMILYNQKKWEGIKQLTDLADSLRSNLISGYDAKRFQNLSENEKKTKLEKIDQFFESSKNKYLRYGELRTVYPVDWDYLSKNLNKVVETVIVGYVEFRNIKKDIFLGAKEIFRIAAQKGFGPYLFELAFSYAALQHRPVVIDRKECSPAARKVWQLFDTRRYIIKYPAALSKYPELIGYTKEEVHQKFGPGAFASVFGPEGYPEGTPGKIRLKSGKIWRTPPFHEAPLSYLEHEAQPGENMVVGKLASLDKAYYYDGRVDELKVLLSCGENKGYSREALFHCGHAFFQSSRSKSG